MRRRFFLLFNPGAGTSKQTRCTAVCNRLIAAGASVESIIAKSAEQARAMAREAALSGHYDAIVAAGGDGTVRQAAAAVIGTKCPVGAIMLGTGNVLAHELKLPHAPDAVAHMLLHGKISTIELALANGEPFLLMAGVGFDGHIIGRLNQQLKRLVGRAAYGPATIGAFRLPLDQLVVEHNGVRSRADWVVVSNARHYGGRFIIGSHSHHITQPGLQLVQFRARHRRDRLRQLTALATGRIDRHAALKDSSVQLSFCNEVTITSATPVPVQIDGDAFGTTPLHIKRAGELVNLIVP